MYSKEAATRKQSYFYMMAICCTREKGCTTTKERFLRQWSKYNAYGSNRYTSDCEREVLQEGCAVPRNAGVVLGALVLTLPVPS